MITVKNSITKKTQLESYAKVIPKRENRKEMIMAVLRNGNKDGMTAEEVLEQLIADGKTTIRDMNYVRPRLTELKESGKVKVVGSRISSTRVRTAVWKIV